MRQTILLFLTLIVAVALIASSLSSASPIDAGPEVAAPADGAGVAVPSEPTEVVGLFAQMLDAYKTGHWSLGFVLTVMIAVFGLRWFATKWERLSWFQTQWGGWALVLIGTASGTVATALASGVGVSWPLVSQALTIGLAAAGAHELHKNSGLKGA